MAPGKSKLSVSYWINECAVLVQAEHIKRREEERK